MVTHDARPPATPTASCSSPTVASSTRSQQPDHERHPRRAQAPRSVSHVQARIEIHAGQEAAPVQHRPVGDARSRLPGGHARLHRHHRRTFDDLFAGIYAETDSYVRARVERRSRNGGSQRGRMPESVGRDGRRGAGRRRRPGVRRRASPRSSAPTATPSATRDRARRRSA